MSTQQRATFKELRSLLGKSKLCLAQTTPTASPNTPIRTHPHVQAGAGNGEEDGNRKWWKRIEQADIISGDRRASPSSCLLFQSGRSSKEPLITGSSPWGGGGGGGSQVPGDAMRGQFDGRRWDAAWSNGRQLREPWRREIQQRLDGHAHLHQPALLEDVMRQTQLVLWRTDVWLWVSSQSKQDYSWGITAVNISWAKQEASRLFWTLWSCTRIGGCIHVSR